MTTSKLPTITDVLSEAWTLTYGLKWQVAVLMLIIPLLAGTTLLIVLYPFTALLHHAPLVLRLLVGLGCGLFFLMLLWYLLCLVILLGVRQAIGAALNINVAWQACVKVKQKLFYAFMFSVCIYVVYGFIRVYLFPHANYIIHLLLYLILQIAIVPIYFFTIPLILIKHSDTLNAIQSSYTKTLQHWDVVIPCVVIMIVINWVGGLVLIGVIWTMPMYFAMIGILFRDVYGLQRVPTLNMNIHKLSVNKDNAEEVKMKKDITQPETPGNVPDPKDPKKHYPSQDPLAPNENNPINPKTDEPGQP